MNTPIPVQSIPWYRSAVLQGLLTVVVSQSVARLQSHYHIDFSIMDVSVTDVVNWLMDMISAAALAYAAHGRIAKPTPPVTLTKDAS